MHAGERSNFSTTGPLTSGYASVRRVETLNRYILKSWQFGVRCSALGVRCSVFSSFQYLIPQDDSRFYLGIMNEEKHWETAALGKTMVARIEIEEIGIAANEKEMTDAVTALPGVREVKIENGAMHVTYDPLATTEKKIEEAVRASGNTVKAAAADTETPHP
jgi:copper chaperone CopZ